MSSNQSTHTILMIEPAAFYRNDKSAADNFFQSKSAAIEREESQSRALVEFNNLKEMLQNAGLEILLYKDFSGSGTPDSIFPNNWLSTHSESVLVIYPMKVSNRRNERRVDIISDLQNRYQSLLDLSAHERSKSFLEGTGSLVLDRVGKVAYCGLSERSTGALADHWGALLGFKIVKFSAKDENGRPIYHTNVLMSVGTSWAVVCLDAISDEAEKWELVQSLEGSGREIVPISISQMHLFCGNILELARPMAFEAQKPFLAMSSRAYGAFSKQQLDKLGNFCEIIHSDITTIEDLGGGSVRCMLAEIF